MCKENESDEADSLRVQRPKKQGLKSQIPFILPKDFIICSLCPPLTRPYTHKRSAGWGKNACRQGAFRAAALTTHSPHSNTPGMECFLAAAPPELDDQAVGLEPPHRQLGAQPSLTTACCCSSHTLCADPSPSMPRAAQGQQPLSNLCDTTLGQATPKSRPPAQHLMPSAHATPPPVASNPQE